VWNFLPTTAKKSAVATFAILFSLGSLQVASAKGPRQFERPALTRDDFNRLAIQANSPLFWAKDNNSDKKISPDELEVAGTAKERKAFVKAKKFSSKFISAYRDLVELRRRESVAKELDAGRPAMVSNDLSNVSAADKAVVKELIAAGKVIESIYQRQIGSASLTRQLRKADAASRALFWRNQGPECETPVTRGDRFCNALPSFDKPKSETYPAGEKLDKGLCKKLEGDGNARQLLDPFTVVRKKGNGYEAKQLTAVYGKAMKKVAKHLRKAAKALKSDKSEAAFIRYLKATADSFESNNWSEADEAWASMNAKNSRWYLRIGPDEVYRDACQQKASFHLSLALIDQQSLVWQKKLSPLRDKMEKMVAAQIGAPYKAREVRFHMPDFIRMLLNAGDSRSPMGATIGQSLPNWGKVAQEGRGRTVVMTNLYGDADSLRIQREQAELLLAKDTYANFVDDSKPALMNTVLHEAGHNFGPHSDYRIAGKMPKELFGGPGASMLEELKAQTMAIFFLPVLVKEKMITAAVQRQAYTKAIFWSLRHMSRGMFTPGGHPQPYSQLSAIQLGYFLKHGGLRFEDGKYAIDYGKLPKNIDALMTLVGKIKASGDKAGLKRLSDAYVSAEGQKKIHAKAVADVLLRYPKASFRYSILY
jgi:hypothetical protein